MSVKILYFVHGTTYDNASGKASGWNDVELNPLGVQQATQLGEHTRNLSFDVLYSSDLKRAVSSAELAWPNHPLIQDKRLRECNYGNYNGETHDLVVYEKYISRPFLGGESLKDVENRIASFMEDAKRKYYGKTIAVMAHRAPQLAFEILTNNITWEGAIENDWRKKKAWQICWEYEIK